MSTQFSAHWLHLREQADHRARAVALLPPLTEWLPDRHVRVVDLGAGSGSNLRYLSPLLPGPQSWQLVDQDQALMTAATAPDETVRVERYARDLRAAPVLPKGAPHLVTASALLDLVSRPWLEQFAGECRAAGCAVLVSLTYDGRIRWQPDDPDDALLNNLVNGHQRRDKGFGPALGPDAADTAASVFRQHGFRTWLSPSPWQLGGSEAVLQSALLDGWLSAAHEQTDTDHQRLAEWAARRRQHLDTGEGVLIVGHLDLLALPPERA
ncbi:class I SAM-dependent methyltransferase [Aquisalimonas sp.]|uniref:class I SAM-dependent methyltransferase n=1 Tax=unclassified Aquisalimonas TaxID=2644645 RepID=UPI0025C05A4B|nr:class I SAM-dependent methyltransferase [Aquisalimonas sp.]